MQQTPGTSAFKFQTQTEPLYEQITQSIFLQSKDVSEKFPYSLFTIEEKSSIFEVRAFNGPHSCLPIYNNNNTQKLEEEIEELEEKLKKSERNYQRKINCLLNKLDKQKQRQVSYIEEITLLKKQLFQNISMISRLESELVHQEVYDNFLTPTLPRPKYKNYQSSSMRNIPPKS